MGGGFAGLALLILLFGRVTSAWAVDLPLIAPIYGFGVTNAFPNLTFDRPVVLTSPPGETNRLFVVEKSGRVMVIPDLRAPTASVFLDVSQTTYTSMEGGLLGLAFHPQFAQNGRFFIYRVSQPAGFRDELIEFKCDPPSSLSVDPASAKVLFSQRDASDTHNAGDLKFGPDGYLYLSLGNDGPLPPDTHDTPQAIDKGLFGGIIRIDVDGRPGNLAPNPHSSIINGYSIPQDNPFVGATSFNGAAVDPAQVRTEFYAVGMRNPWRFTFDPFTGNLISGDVGEGATEEINIIRKGGNYGWPFMEGTRVAIPDGLPDGLELPAYSYPHSVGLFGGRVVIGGLVYSGKEFPWLVGKYLFTDYDSGNIWAMDLSVPNPAPVWLAAHAGVSAFGIHPANGGILLANHLLGQIDRLIYQDPSLAGIPPTLRDLGAFADLKTLQPNASLIPYDVVNPLWSDGAFKQRWIDSTRAQGHVDFSPDDAYNVPAGTVFLKHFELELTNGVPSSRRRVETRALVKTDSGVYGLTYRWGDSLTNAYLVPPEGTNDTFVINDGGILRTQVWNYPTWDQCQACHNKTAGYILGFRTHQLNRTVLISGSATNQLAWLASQGLFTDSSGIVPEHLTHLAALDDPIAPAQYRVRSYLESNCMHCHQPGGRSEALWDARIKTPLSAAQILGASTLFYPPPMKIIDPGNITNSYMLARVSNRVPLYQMPPIATSITDDSFINLLSTWIQQMPGADWQSADIGSSGGAEGSLAIIGDAYRVYSAAEGVAANSIYFNGRTAFGSSELVARLSTITSSSTNAEAGLMIRQTLDSDSVSAALIRKGRFSQLWVKTNAATDYQLITSVPAFLGNHFRLVTDGQNASAWIADDSLNWFSIGTTPLPLSGAYLAGFAAASAGGASEFAAAQFDNLAVFSVSMDPLTSAAATLPAQIQLSAQISTLGAEAPQLTFRSDTTTLATLTAGPWAVLWTNIPEGDFQISAVLAGSHSSITSAPVSLQAVSPNSQVWLKPADRRTAGDWASRYGQTAYLIPGITNRLSSEVQITLQNGSVNIVGNSTNRSALQVQGAGVASVLHSSGPLELTFRAADYGVHQAELYFRDWINAGRTQQVSFLDPHSNQLLTKTNLSAFPPAYLPFVFRNDVLVRIENSQGDSYVTGIFVDPVPPISVDLASPDDGSSLTQPASVQLSVNALAPGRQVARVELWDNNALLSSFTNAAFQLTLTNLFPGTHSLKAVAWGTFGTSNESDPITVTILPAPSRAQFLGVDDRTQGSWKGRYGQDGWWLIGDDQQAPNSLQMSSADGRLYIFSQSSSDPAALQRPYLDDRFAGCLYGAPEFSVDLSLRDGQPCTAGFYFLDWEDTRRLMDVVVEAPDGSQLDRQTVTDFHTGKYLFWTVQGNVHFRISSPGVNAVVSAIFLDHAVTPYTLWRNELFNSDEVRALGTQFNSADSDGDGFSNALEYYLGYDPRSAADKPQFRYSLSGGWFQINFSQRTQPPDMALVLETSLDLVHWTRIQPTAITQPGTDANRVSFNIPAQSQSQLFIRYSLTAP